MIRLILGNYEIFDTGYEVFHIKKRVQIFSKGPVNQEKRATTKKKKKRVKNIACNYHSCIEYRLPTEQTLQ